MSDCKVAYLILAHTDAPHLAKLVNTLDYRARLFIHLDRKADRTAFDAFHLPPSAEFIPDSVRVSWGAFSIVQATLNLIKAALDSGETFSHLVLLSGQDYPIKSPEAIYRFLTAHPQRQFIRFLDMTTSPNHHMRRIIDYWFWEPWLPAVPAIDRFMRIAMLKIAHRLRPLIAKKPLEGITPAFGSQWWAITPDCAAYILQFVADNPRFMKFYRYVHAPDEHFFHTIIANSPYIDQTNGFEDCPHCGPHRLANLHAIATSLNKVHQVSDFDELRQSHQLFVRKVTSTESSALLARLDELFCAETAAQPIQHDERLTETSCSQTPSL